MKTYPVLRTTHLLCGAFALPMLWMYGVSAVQMAHSTWFRLRPEVTERQTPAPRGYTDGRALAREVMETQKIRGEIASIQATPAGFDVRVEVPGTVHEIRYDGVRGAVRLRSSVSGVMGMLNRLHHAAGLWHPYLFLRLWGALAGLVSVATLALGATGLWLWWLRREERKWGLILLTANVVFAAALLATLRSAGP